MSIVSREHTVFAVSPWIDRRRQRLERAREMAHVLAAALKSKTTDLPKSQDLHVDEIYAFDLSGLDIPPMRMTSAICQLASEPLDTISLLPQAPPDRNIGGRAMAAADDEQTEGISKELDLCSLLHAANQQAGKEGVYDGVNNFL